MINRDELRTVTGAVGLAEVTIGNPVPVDMVRFIYRIRYISTFAGPNQLQIGSRENGAVGTTALDFLQSAVIDEMITDPDELKEDAAPLYVIHGGPSRGTTATVPPSTSLVRFLTDAGAGIVTYWYLDKEA